MDDLLRLELDLLLESAREARASRPDQQPQGDDAPLALDPARCSEVGKVLRRIQDPDADQGHKMAVRRVLAVHEPDERGLVEVSYLDAELRPMTAFMAGDELAYVAEGW